MEEIPLELILTWDQTSIKFVICLMEKWGSPSNQQIGAKWLMEIAEYLSDNPQFIMNGFMHSGITGAIDGVEDKTESDNQLNNSDDSRICHPTKLEDAKCASALQKTGRQSGTLVGFMCTLNPKTPNAPQLYKSLAGNLAKDNL